jgi:hypothetical protein
VKRVYRPRDFFMVDLLGLRLGERSGYDHLSGAEDDVGHYPIGINRYCNMGYSESIV